MEEAEEFPSNKNVRWYLDVQVEIKQLDSLALLGIGQVDVNEV